MLSLLDMLMHILDSHPGRFEWGQIDDFFHSILGDVLGSIYVAYMESIYTIVLNFILR